MTSLKTLLNYSCSAGPMLALALALAVASGNAIALDDYRCRIQAVHAPDEGKADSIVHGLRKTWIGTEFSVSRKTGAMVGALRNNYWNEPQVIDRGSAKANSFKAVTTLRPNEGLGPGSAVHVLVIDEFLETPEKTFTYLEGSEVISVYANTMSYRRGYADLARRQMPNLFEGLIQLRSGMLNAAALILISSATVRGAHRGRTLTLGLNRN